MKRYGWKRRSRLSLDNAWHRLPLFCRVVFDRGEDYVAWIVGADGRRHAGIDIDSFHAAYRRIG